MILNIQAVIMSSVPFNEVDPRIKAANPAWENKLTKRYSNLSKIFQKIYLNFLKAI